MTSQIIGLRVVGTIFGLLCIGHLLRLVAEAEMIIADYQVPLWMSGLGLVIAGALSFWMWRLSFTAAKQES